MEKIINWMVAWSSWTWLSRIDSTSHQRKSIVLDVCNQWSQNVMPRLVTKDLTVELAVVVIQQPCMVMCQKGKGMPKIIKGAMKMMSLSPIALLIQASADEKQENATIARLVTKFKSYRRVKSPTPPTK